MRVPEGERQLALQRQRRNRSLTIHAIALSLAVLLGTGLFVTRVEPHPAYPGSVALAERLDGVFVAVAAGRERLSPTPRSLAPGVTAAAVSIGDRVLGVATGEAGGDCYAHWWDTELVRHARVLAATIPCAPATIVASIRPIHFERLGPVQRDAGQAYPWERLLPTPTRQRLWFLPAMVVVAGIGLSIVTRMVTTVITGRTPAEVAREERLRKR